MAIRLRFAIPLCAILFIALHSACSSPAEPDSPPPPEGTVRQFRIIGDPLIFIPDGYPDQLMFVVNAMDSTPHRNWWPTKIMIETDRGFQKESELAPFACIEPSERGPTFPLNFKWWSCNRIYIYNHSALTADQIAEINTMIGGRLVYHYEFKNMPGAQYLFAVATGRSAINKALKQLATLSYIDIAHHGENEPRCVLSDELPPPPCPPWYLFDRLPFTFSDTPGSSLPVSPQGWVRATYTQPNGERRSATFRF